MKKSNLSENNFEVEHIITALKEKGYVKRNSKEDYNKKLCLDTEFLLNYIRETQKEEWEKYKEYRKNPKRSLTQRVSREIKTKGVLHVLRNGIKDRGHKFDLLTFKPVSSRNPDHFKDYKANKFSVINQLYYSEKNSKSIDLVLFLNGIPLFAMEIKNKFTGQDYRDAITQWKKDRNPNEDLFEKIIALFALDNDKVYYATKLEGEETKFLPFNKDIENPKDDRGFKVAYLYRDILSPDSTLNLLEKFIHVYEDNEKDKEFQVFPRYHQLNTVRSLVKEIKNNGAGKDYLIQHSAGSGKTFTISWLAHQISELHNENDKRIFDTVVVVSDRTVIDKQLKNAVRQFEETEGNVVWAQKSTDLSRALETGKNIVVTTIQKFPYALDKIEELDGSEFAVIIDEAHSGQGGTLTQKMNKTLQYDSLEQAEKEDQGAEIDMETQIVNDVMQRQKTRDQISYFAFTATPKKETLELFGTKNREGGYEPFSIYSMKQAIEEGFILDVLEHYMSYKTYFQLSKKIENDPEYEKRKAKAQLVRYATLEKNAIEKKVKVMLDHYDAHVKSSVAERGKAMLVTRSRLHVIKYKKEFDKQINEQNINTKAIAAFSGSIDYNGKEHTETNLNGFPAGEIKDKFDTEEYRIMIAANKFQTGFDQPLLETMWVDKPLSGVDAVQTLSRLNRTHESKDRATVLDFVNEPTKIQNSFQPFYQTRMLLEKTNPNILYDLEYKIRQEGVIDKMDLDDFINSWYSSSDQSKLHKALDGSVRRYSKLEEENQIEFKSTLRKFIKNYELILQVVKFQDNDLHKLYLYSKLLVKKLPIDRESRPKDILKNVDLAKYDLFKEFDGTISLLDKEKEEIEPDNSIETKTINDEELDSLSLIIEEVNQEFGDIFKDEKHAKEKISQMASDLEGNKELQKSMKSNPRDDLRLLFNKMFQDKLTSLYDKDFDFWEKLQENPDAKEKLKKKLFEVVMDG